MAVIYISLGSNIDRDLYVKKGIDAITAAFDDVELSSLYECDPVGFVGDAFYNLVIKCSTELAIDQVAVALREIEFANGREQNAKKFSPRTLDLDLLLYDDMICDTPVQLPRYEITENAFVLWPLAELAPSLHHPTENMSYQALWQAFDKASQPIRKVPSPWQHNA